MRRIVEKGWKPTRLYPKCPAGKHKWGNLSRLINERVHPDGTVTCKACDNNERLRKLVAFHSAKYKAEDTE